MNSDFGQFCATKRKVNASNGVLFFSWLPSSCVGNNGLKLKLKTKFWNFSFFNVWHLEPTISLLMIFLCMIFLEKKWLQRSYSQFYGICRGRWIVFMTEPITLYHDFPAKGVPHIFWTIRLKCLLAQITVPWHFYGPIQFQDYTGGYFLTHERAIHLPQKYLTTFKLQHHFFSKGATVTKQDSRKIKFLCCWL